MDTCYASRSRCRRIEDTLETTLTFWADNSKDCSLFGSRVFAVGRPQAKKSNLFSGFFSPKVMTVQPVMAFRKVFFGGHALKVVRTVVRFVAVDVVNVLFGVKPVKPASRYNAMHEPLPAKRQISTAVLDGCVRVHLSKNFPAARNSVKMVKHTVFNTIHRKAFHVGSPKSIVTDQLYHRYTEM
jgi:hypothetical protein